MPKAKDPAQLSGQDKVELASEPTSESIQKMITDSVAEGLGRVQAEMLEESKKQAREAAEKVLEGKGDEASKVDPENVYGKDFVEMFRGMLTPKGPEPKSDGPVNAIAKAAYYLHKAGGNAHIANDLMGQDGVVGKDLEIAQKALGVDGFTSGGALLQGDMFDEVVPELLTETALVSDGNIMRVPMNGQLTVPYESTGPDTRHVEENAAANASEPTFDQLVLTERQATIVVPASKKMLRTVGMAARAIEQSMRRSLAVDVDNKLIRGVGAASEPTGLRYLADSGNLLNVNGTVSAANSIIDLTRLQEAVQNSNVMWTAARSRTAISPRIWRYLFSLRDNDGYVLQQEMATQNSILGIPVAGQSGRGITAIPENLAVTDTSESEIYFYSQDWLMLGIGEDLRLEMSDSAAYNDSAGAVQSAFSRDQVVWKLVFNYDFGSRVRGHDIAVLIDCDWGV